MLRDLLIKKVTKLKKIGGANWFGGLNEPLRGGKLTPFEGGVKVPAFIYDLSKNYTMTNGQELNHMVHIADWMPTFLAWANTDLQLKNDLNLDGLDQSEAFKSGKVVRKNVLTELFTGQESHDGSESIAYRKGKYKLVKGNIRDPHWYKEPTEDKVATTDTSLLPRIIEVEILILL